jgi:hypothetical protein
MIPKIKYVILTTTSFVLILLLTSCDRWGHYQFKVKNEINKKITLTYLNRDDNSLHSAIINAGDSLIILTTMSENLGKWEKPNGVWKNSDTLSVFKDLQIAIDTVKINKCFLIAREWTYNPLSREIGIYTLHINENAVEKRDSL